ncbi:MAG: EscU/YscU/HrcU family type III secretion system export apparatus switch protein, partial [Spirochaetaceae bacterium]|nr:EscU/YscU/HrcU family type III secretion system export apparatus switch protein [Spirochaetaceae bacterium]
MIGRYFGSGISLVEDTRFGLHLQWFAAEDEGRTEDPTERKIRKAREEGKVAKSGDITSAIVMLFGLVTLMAFSGNLIRITADMLRFFISTATAESRNSYAALAAVGNYLIRLITPVMSVCFIAAFLGNVLQVGFLFSTKPITPDFSKIAPNFGKWAQKSFFS